MFTGLVEAVATLRRSTPVSGGKAIELDVDWPDDEIPAVGDSIAVNGACLTAVTVTSRGFTAELSSETLRRTLLGRLQPGTRVNVERALRLGDRLGGHIVQGHVDATVRLLAIRPEGRFSRWSLSLPHEHAREVVEKGSVCLDGVSLTVASLATDAFDVALIAETLAGTTLGTLGPGASLHLETDILAKYVAQQLTGGPRSLINDIFGEATSHA
jgi:riboflavin synthase